MRWQVQKDALAVELVGRIDDFVSMGFGPSGLASSIFMVGADPVIADFDAEGAPRARDFYMSSRAQCRNGDGVCPDTSGDGLVDDVANVSGEQDAGLTLVRYTRLLTPSDLDAKVGDQTVDLSIAVESGKETFVVWALGPISADADHPNFHPTAFARSDVSIEFGRAPVDHCLPLAVDDVASPTFAPADPVEAFDRPIIRDTTDLVARIGPSGGNRGYAAISGGRTPWGIAWYVNDLLVPVIEMRRGTTYRFHVSGGDDPTQGAEFHPLYRTSSISGGYAQLNSAERLDETLLAGIEITAQDGDGVNAFDSPAMAPICLYRVTDSTPTAQDGSYADFFASLDTSCSADTVIADAAAVLEFTPDEATPDLIYSIR